MSYLECVDTEYRDGRVDTEALEARQHSVGPNEEGDHVGEGSDGDGDPGVPHSLTKPGIEIFIITIFLWAYFYNMTGLRPLTDSKLLLYFLGPKIF